MPTVQGVGELWHKWAVVMLVCRVWWFCCRHTVLAMLGCAVPRHVGPCYAMLCHDELQQWGSHK